jgi:hypothetical protein
MSGKEVGVVREDMIEKYVRDSEGLKREIESYKQRYPEFSIDLPVSIFKNENEERIMYHETVIFLFSIIYKYLVFERIPVFSGGKGLDAIIAHRDDVINVEFEVLSSQFIDHTEKEKEDCKLLVCWRDNSRKRHDFWKHIDVIELKYLFEKT